MVMGFRKVKMVIDSNLEDIPLIGIAVNRFSTYAAFSETDAFNIELCVVEGVTNAIKHAYGEQRGQEVIIQFSLSSKEAVFEICDRGNPMDPEKLKRAVLNRSSSEKNTVYGISESGRGLGIMKEIMDEVTYRSENGYNCLTLKKSLP